ncbi:MAG: hypothetical protein ACLR1P_06025 [Oscillospiraceae bacterium]
MQLAIPKYVMPIGVSLFHAAGAVLHRGRAARRHKSGHESAAPDAVHQLLPQIVEGPICRYDQTAQQLWDAKPITYENLTLGLQRIAYGMMKKGHHRRPAQPAREKCL